MAFKLRTERSITDVIFIAKQLQGHYRAITSILKIFILHINNTKISYLCNEICLNLTHFKNNFILYGTKNSGAGICYHPFIDQQTTFDNILLIFNYLNDHSSL